MLIWQMSIRWLSQQVGSTGMNWILISWLPAQWTGDPNLTFWSRPRSTQTKHPNTPREVALCSVPMNPFRSPLNLSLLTSALDSGSFLQGAPVQDAHLCYSLPSLLSPAPLLSQTQSGTQSPGLPSCPGFSGAPPTALGAAYLFFPG